MRFLRRQSTNARGIYGNKDIRRDINGQVVLDSTDMMLVPTGTTAQKITSPVNGHMRYNTTTNVFENYQAGSWAPIRRFEPANIGDIWHETVAAAGGGECPPHQPGMLQLLPGRDGTDGFFIAILQAKLH